MDRGERDAARGSGLDIVCGAQAARDGRWRRRAAAAAAGCVSGGLRHLRAAKGGLFVTRAKRRAASPIAQKCPHLGCAVPFCESSGRFECPCHGSVFNAAGEWISGPSPRGMDKYPVQIADGRVLVNTTVLEEGAPLGSKKFDVPARGPSCATEQAG
ncbi:MAG: Rieske 2Fe-2S domain-containing protein [Gemmatimonadaceae bacterium]|nr:Rieske 2Fe-2S domain-containing protein [Gemmatimonadaceae bacterium]